MSRCPDTAGRSARARGVARAASASGSGWSRSNIAMNSVSVRNGWAPISNSSTWSWAASAARSASVNASQVVASPARQLRIWFARSASHHATVPRGSAAVALDQLGVAVDREQELVQQVPAHASASVRVPGEVGLHRVEQVEVVDVVGLALSPATPIISMKSMNPWVALPGACRLSSVTSDRQPSMSPRAIHSTARASNSGSGPCGPNWRGPPSSSERCPVPITATRMSAATTRPARATSGRASRTVRAGSGGAKMLV